VRGGGRAVVAAQQNRRQEGTALGVRAGYREVVRVTADDGGGCRERLDGPQHFLALLEAGQRAHGDALGARVTDDDFGQVLAGGVDDGVGQRAWHQGAADGGALLAGFAGHLDNQLLDVQLELGGVRGGVRAEDGAVQ